jgi:alkanesulfonate monooxygenase SsuD/methylene tetrahydromethanopterin reductase-like flavin-dependent oxidoreductase (luciferase family)
VGVLIHAYCDETDEDARRVAGQPNIEYVHLAYTGYPRLAKLAKSYEYMGALAAVADKINDLDYLIHDSGAAVIGSPESCIQQIERFKQAGADEVLLRIDSVPHDKIMKAIELFGRYVIPHFKHPENVVRPADRVLADIRVMRERAKAQGIYVELSEERGKTRA